MKQNIDPYQAPANIGEIVPLSEESSFPKIRYIIGSIVLFTTLGIMIYSFINEWHNVSSLKLFSVFWFLNQILSFSLFTISTVLLVKRKSLFFNFYAAGIFSQTVIANLRMFLFGGWERTSFYNPSIVSISFGGVFLFLMVYMFWILKKSACG